MKRDLAALFLAGAVALAASASGCASIEGGRLYTSGTEALDSGDVEHAVDALERAAALVPQASEIQNHLAVSQDCVAQVKSVNNPEGIDFLEGGQRLIQVSHQIIRAFQTYRDSQQVSRRFRLWSFD